MKLFCCKVEVVLYALAKDADEARDIAAVHAVDEDDPAVTVLEVDTGDATRAGWGNSIPYGDSPDDRTVNQIAAQMKTDEAERERLAGLEARQDAKKEGRR